MIYWSINLYDLWIVHCLYHCFMCILKALRVLWSLDRSKNTCFIVCIVPFCTLWSLDGWILWTLGSLLALLLLVYCDLWPMAEAAQTPITPLLITVPADPEFVKSLTNSLQIFTKNSQPIPNYRNHSIIDHNCSWYGICHNNHNHHNQHLFLP